MKKLVTVVVILAFSSMAVFAAPGKQAVVQDKIEPVAVGFIGDQKVPDVELDLFVNV